MRKRGNRNAPQPQSAMNKAYAVSRVLRQKGFEYVSMKKLTGVLDGMMMQYIRKHGSWGLRAQHKIPFSSLHIRHIFNAKIGVPLPGSRSFEWSTMLGKAMRAAFAYIVCLY